MRAISRFAALVFVGGIFASGCGGNGREGGRESADETSSSITAENMDDYVDRLEEEISADEER